MSYGELRANHSPRNAGIPLSLPARSRRPAPIGAPLARACAAYAPQAPPGLLPARPSMIYSLINLTVPSVKLIRAAP